MKTRVMIILVILLAAFTKLYFASAYFGNFDQESYEIVVNVIKNGGNIYAETQRYNYTPVWSFVLIFLDSTAQVLNVPFHTAVRGFLTLVDVVNTIFIGLIAAKLRPGYSLHSIISYSLNPVPLLIVGYHGQFDCLASLPMLVAVYILVSRPTPPRNLIWVLGTIALLIKHITFFGVWVLFAQTVHNNKKAILMLIASVIVFLLTFVPYVSTGWHGILQNVFLYKGLSGYYGLSLFLPRIANYVLFSVVMVTLPLLAKNLDKKLTTRSIELSFASFLSTVPGIGEQYFLLPIIWGSISPTRWYWVYSIFTTLFLIASPSNIHLLNISLIGQVVLWNFVWTCALIWFIGLSRKLFFGIKGME